MVNKLFVASTTRNKMPPEKSLGVGWESLKCSFYLLLLLIMLSPQAFVLVSSRIIQIFDRAIVISKCGGRQHSVCVAFLLSEEYSITHYKLKDCLDPWQNEVTTSDRYQWPSIRLWLWITLDCWIRHFSSTANWKYIYGGKISRFEKKKRWYGKTIVIRVQKFSDLKFTF